LEALETTLKSKTKSTEMQMTIRLALVALMVSGLFVGQASAQTESTMIAECGVKIASLPGPWSKQDSRKKATYSEIFRVATAGENRSRIVAAVAKPGSAWSLEENKVAETLTGVASAFLASDRQLVGLPTSGKVGSLAFVFQTSKKAGTSGGRSTPMGLLLSSLPNGCYLVIANDEDGNQAMTGSDPSGLAEDVAQILKAVVPN
jgi:hypothetical protein